MLALVKGVAVLCARLARVSGRADRREKVVAGRQAAAPALDRRSRWMISIKGFSQSGDRFTGFTPALISRERVLDFSLEPRCMRRNVWT